MFRFLRRSGRVAWAYLGGVLLTFVATAALLTSTAEARFRRDVSRMVFNDNLQLLEKIRARTGLNSSLERLATAPETPGDRQFIVVSIEERRLWLKQGDSVLFWPGGDGEREDAREGGARRSGSSRPRAAT